MSFRPLYGHHPLRQRLTAAASDGRLPASLLFQGRRGVGKQRLGLWLGQFLLCDRATTEGLREPCGACQHCRYAERGVHPDLHWFFPRPRLKDGDASTDDVKADVAEAVAERMGDEGLWSPPPGTEGLYVATVRALVHMASLRPAMARRAVFVVGDAERMVSQEGADQAANAFLKFASHICRGPHRFSSHAPILRASAERDQGLSRNTHTARSRLALSKHGGVGA